MKRVRTAVLDPPSPAQVQDRQPLSSMTTQLGSQVPKSKEGQPPAPGTLVTAPDVLLDCPPDGAGVVAES